MEHHGFRAWVISNNVESAIYCSRPNDRLMTGWIASEPGQSFSVNVQDLSNESSARTRFTVDGLHIAKRTTRCPGEVMSRQAYRTSKDEVQPLVFHQVNTTDDDSVARPGQGPNELGTIRLEVERVVIKGSSMRAGPYVGKAAARLAPRTLHERDKKLGSQSVGLGNPVAKRSLGCKFDTMPYPPGATVGEPWVVFEFYYRSEAFLKAKGIIPSHDTLVSSAHSAPPRKKRLREGDIGAKRAQAQQGCKVEELHETIEEKTAREDRKSPKLETQVIGIIAPAKRSSSPEWRDRKRKPPPIKHPVSWKSGEIIDLTGLD
ncbi:hypothetical protein BKA62DRAFT_700244 [Auriculariales sp. MPI-PUGE-AT-0066]|nr:hypothetical protein BKA62DRAFT_700244 [Auriculariales sp. MPI-PUGE-AT-0066]